MTTKANRLAMTARISGRVQGVFYRNWTQEQAMRLGLSGWVQNEPDGSVRALFAGAPAAVSEMIGLCRRGPKSARVTGVETQLIAPIPAEGAEDAGFRVNR